ncbi:MAG: transmembrane 220 family protein [Acidobacteriota bacterium]|nr:transmembrane 220 family protein [Acidobacteriota bacterium]
MAEENAIPDTLEMPSKTAKLGVGTMGMLLVFAAVVQYNDPDPYAWLVLYLAAAGVSFAAVWFPDLWKIPAVVAVGAFIWAATLVPTVTQTSFPDLFQSWEMMSREMEEGREFLGLLSVASWTTYLVHRGRKTQQ